MLFAEASAIEVSICDLMRERDRFAGKPVAVRATVKNSFPHGIWLIDLSDQKCVISISSLHAFDAHGEAAELFGPMGGPAWHVSFSAIVSGTFETVPILMYGHPIREPVIRDAQVQRQER